MEQFITYPLETQLIYLQTEFKRQNELQEDRIKSTKTLQQVQNELSIAQARQTGLNNIGTLFLQLKNRTEYGGFKKIEQIKAISLS